MKSKFILALVISSNAVALFAQLAPSAATVQSSVTTNVQKLKEDFPDAKVTLNPSTGLPSSITGLDSAKKAELKGSDPIDSVNKVLNDSAVKALFDAAIGTTIKATLKRVDTYEDPVLKGNTIVSFRQEIAGIPVYGSEAKFVVNPGAAVSEASFNLATSTPDVVTSRAISADSAKQIAQSTYLDLITGDDALKRSETAMFGATPVPGTPELVMFDPTKSGEKATAGLRPTWVIRIGGMVFFVDANRGGILHRYRDVHTLAPFVIKASSKTAVSESLPDGTIAINDTSSAFYNEAAAALSNAQTVRSFYKSINREILGKCHCDPTLVEPQSLIFNIDAPNVDNSYWQNFERAAYFAPGSAAYLDVVGHEMTHGVSEFVSCLPYDNDSASVSEFFSDFFAAMIRHRAGIPPWAIGDGLQQFAPPNDPLRSLQNPHLSGFNPHAVRSDRNRGQPELLTEKVSGDDNAGDMICLSTLDKYNGCPHFNSGILNKAAYLATVGGFFQGETYTGVGFDKMVGIMNAALSEMVGPIDFSGVAIKISHACDDLSKAQQDQISDLDCTNVRRAFAAVGIAQPIVLQ